MRVLKAREADRRASAVEARAVFASRSCALSFFSAAYTQVVPIGTIQAYILMLHGNVLLKQGLRPCKMVDGCVFFHSNLRHPPTTLTIPMPSAISIAHTSPFDSLIRTGQQTLRYRQTACLENVCDLAVAKSRGWRLHSYADWACGYGEPWSAYSVCCLSRARCDLSVHMLGRLSSMIGQPGQS